jgi:hypothetical protein
MELSKQKKKKLLLIMAGSGSFKYEFNGLVTFGTNNVIGIRCFRLSLVLVEVREISTDRLSEVAMERQSVEISTKLICLTSNQTVEIMATTTEIWLLRLEIIAMATAMLMQQLSGPADPRPASQLF